MWPANSHADIRAVCVEATKSAVMRVGDASDADSFVDLLRDALWAMRNSAFPGPDGHATFLASVCSGQDGCALLRALEGHGVRLSQCRNVHNSMKM